MIKYLFCIFTLISFNAWSVVRIDLHFPDAEVVQGNIETAKLTMSSDGVQKVQLQKLKGQTLGETLHLHSVSSLMKKQGGEGFEAEAKVIFVKVPEAKSISHKIAPEDLIINFPDVSVKPIEAPEKLIFTDFDIPARPKLFLWASIILFLILGPIFGRKFYLKLKHKKEKKLKRDQLKAVLYSGDSYENIVSIWMRREEFLKAFPHIESSFRKFELVLFKYQFKPAQSDVEKQIILDAYRTFLQEVSGGFNGV